MLSSSFLTLVLTSALTLSPSPCLANPHHAPACRAVPGTRGWPAESQWAKLNRTVSGRLISPVPPGGVCHEGQPNYNEATCPAVAKEWFTHAFHAADPVSVMWNSWANWTCLPDENVSCSGKGYPVYVVDARSVKDVKAGIDFARDHNVRLNIKSTGHDYLGRSVAPNALSIWVHHLTSKVYHPAGSFRFSSSGRRYKGTAITVGGGTQMFDVLQEADRHGQVVVGGMGNTVSVGGYVTGGGHSLLTPRHGLAADNVIEMEVVTPNGELVKANEYSHSDLFWAMRGGGGSTFGVLTSVTMKTYPTPKLSSANVLIGAKPKSPILADMIAYVISHFPSLVEQGISGHSISSSNTSSPEPSLVNGTYGGIDIRVIVQDTTDPKKLIDAFAPIKEGIAKRFGKDAIFRMTPPQAWGTYFEFFQKNYDDSPSGASILADSRLVHKDALVNNQEKLSNAVGAVLEGTGQLQAFMVAPTGIRERDIPGGGNSVVPGWRKAQVFTIGVIPFPDFDTAAEAAASTTLSQAFEPFKKLTPGMGTYMNEANAFEANPHETFWGSNYGRLASLKKRYDPRDVFWCFPCIGHETWKEEADGSLCRVRR